MRRSAVLDSDIPGLRRHAVGRQRQPGPGRDPASGGRDGSRDRRQEERPHVVVFRSTLVPGTVEDVLRPIIEAQSGKKDGKDFFLCFQPEFLREGSSIRDYDKPPFTVVGANHPLRSSACASLFGTCRASSSRPRCAFGRDDEILLQQFSCPQDHFRQRNRPLCHALGVDPFEVMDLVCQDTQLNISQGLPQARLCLRRFLPAQGPARDHLPGQDPRRRESHAGRHHAVEPPPSGPRLAQNCWRWASGKSVSSVCRSRPVPTTCARARW
jgi:hypothetical protein